MFWNFEIKVAILTRKFKCQNLQVYISELLEDFQICVKLLEFKFLKLF